MAGRLNSLTDVLKKTLFFFEALSVTELTPHVHRKMLKDYSLSQVGEKVNLCLRQHPCFYQEKENWCLNLEGLRENDQFYSLLLKRNQPLNLRDLMKNGNSKKRKTKKVLAEEVLLISDGRFIQMDNGYWGLTEWEVEASHYSLKHLIIKAMKMNPGGLSVQQICEVTGGWRTTGPKVVEGVLLKFPYFEQVGEGVWIYNSATQVVYEDLLKKFLGMVGRQKLRWRRERYRWKEKTESLQKNLQEVVVGQKEVAAALAEKVELTAQHDYLLTQMAEKDLLLSLRKREIMRYREHLRKLEQKADSILYQCRLWVARAREAEENVNKARILASKNQSSLEGLFTKLQHYKEKDRENKTRALELKEQHAIKVAELQTEIVQLKQKIERKRSAAVMEERRMLEEINNLSNSLKKSLKAEEEQQLAYSLAQHELAATKENYRTLERQVRNPFVRLVMKIASYFKGTPKRSTQ